MPSPRVFRFDWLMRLIPKWGIGVLVFCPLGLASCQQEEDVRLQVSFFWGGGEAREWNAELGIQEEPGAKARIPWMWLTDFEAGDFYSAGGRFPKPAQSLPNAWRAATPVDFIPGQPRALAEADASGRGALVRTTTDGEADGICFEFQGAASSEFIASFTDRAPIRIRVGDLRKEAVVLPIDESGNVFIAQAVDLSRNAPPFVDHGDRQARRTSLHSHSCFSTNTMPLEPVHESLRPFVDSVWWTDHSVGDRRTVKDGDFETADLRDTFWQTYVDQARVIKAELSDDANSGAKAYRLVIASGDKPGFGCIFVGQSAGDFNLGLVAKPTLRWSFKALPRPDGTSSSVYGLVALSSGRIIRYFSGQPNELNPDTDILLGDATGEWQTIERDVAADAASLYGNLGTDGFKRMSFGVHCPTGQRSGALFDDIELVVPEPAEVLRLQAEQLETFSDPKSYPGLEQSAWTSSDDFGALIPHFTALVPARAPELLTGLDHAPTDDERRQFVESIQAGGGVVGTHHMQLNHHFEAFLNGRGFGADMFEIGGAWWYVPAYATEAERLDRDAHGYPKLQEDEVYPLLVRWDRLTARGLLLTGYGAPDLHMRFDGPSYGWLNRWLTWVIDEDDSPEAQLRALRSGQASASEWRSDAILTLDVEGREWMGKLVVTDRKEQRVTAKVTGALPGSRLRWVRGPLVRDTASAEGFEPARIGAVREDEVGRSEYASSLAIDTNRGVFVRAELLNPAGHIVALSNPVVFAPYWPSEWPAGRVAFDWNGATMESASGMLLTSARITEAGELSLSGAVGTHPADARLVLGGLPQTARVANDESVAIQFADESAVLSGFDAGDFQITLTGFDSLERGETAELLAIPDQKELLRVIEVGDPKSEAGWRGRGFGPPIVESRILEPILDTHRVLTAKKASFRLSVPVGETTWLRLRTTGYSPVSGQVLMDGEELGSFRTMESLTFEVPATEPGAEGDRIAQFGIELQSVKKPTRPGVPLMRLVRIELWAGDGVVDY